MRKACTSLTQVALALSLFAACAALARAQQARDPRLVSAKAGGVNFTAGDVTVRRAGQKSWQSLLRTDDLRSGDTVRTGADGRAEVLLNPGSYLRLGENTEFELTDTALNTLRLKVTRGSALIEAIVPEGEARPVAAPATAPRGSVIEAAARDSAGFVILIDTPQAQALVVRSGIYRVNVSESGATEFVVRDGRALVGRDAVLVKGGKVATVSQGGAVEVAKFEKGRKDELDAWGKRRAEEMARVNNHLPTRALDRTLASMSWDRFDWGFRPTGLWYYDAASLCYTYLPFFGWSSPYGYAYYVAVPGLWNRCDCWRGDIVLRAPPNYPTRGTSGGGGGWTNGGGGSGGGGSTGGGATGGGSGLGGGPSLGGGNTITRPTVEPPSAPAVQHSGSGNVRRMEPPL